MFSKAIVVLAHDILGHVFSYFIFVLKQIRGEVRLVSIGGITIRVARMSVQWENKGRCKRILRVFWAFQCNGSDFLDFAKGTAA